MDGRFSGVGFFDGRIEHLLRFLVEGKVVEPTVCYGGSCFGGAFFCAFARSASKSAPPQRLHSGLAVRDPDLGFQHVEYCKSERRLKRDIFLWSTFSCRHQKYPSIVESSNLRSLKRACIQQAGL